ncbi:hypothetical protein H7E67_07870 [Clostridium gasigenes]|uniref:Hydroxyneurosporene synthase (CrtC) n=1 Tax=Clostridium gasigenes TaxID=94869 RepID=A0A7X0S937_9CLOT|nr:lipocalin-like domain-containing protein [Clostridium gasigenes]MBB6623342.1 hypothetical protein [Clostridium gasigenes]MBB6713240.1 hypothetical protein [Clostridium gasigenes]MBU3088033.1 hypothetical protein [Clostridium gasigenes]MBU3107892.1 hypothetical protein [Clostridium gasigenes]
MNKLLEVAMSEEWFEKEGLEQEPAIWEDGIRIDTGSGKFEWWYFDAHLDDGTTVVAIFFTKSYANIKVPLTPLVKLSITTPEGKTYLKLIEFPKGDFMASDKQCDIKVANNWVKGDLKTYNLHIDFEEISADLQFNRVVPSWRPGVGKCFFGEAKKEFFAWFVPIPYGTVSGKLKFEGKEHEVMGTGYHDHNWGNVPLTKVIDHWYWGRVDIGEYKAIFFEMISAKKYCYERVNLFMFAKGDKILIGDGSKLTLEKSDYITHRGGKKYPEQLTFHWKDKNDSIEINISNPELIEDRSLLSGMPFLKRKIAGVVVNPYYFRFNGKTEININYKDIKENVKDKSLYEIMMLK